ADRDRGQIHEPHDDRIDARKIRAREGQNQKLIELRLQVEDYLRAGDIDRVSQPAPIEHRFEPELLARIEEQNSHRERKSIRGGIEQRPAPEVARGGKHEYGGRKGPDRRTENGEKRATAETFEPIVDDDDRFRGPP